ncbi:hypothetical protein [Nonlabens marinus]|uniref:Uncharacterized protein n=1 Tax=Nonlabens marinus S1-08 TaxID=1454201 RepID=W8VZ65_9FLAO|nr:hypothetical protein [Nonlabens marinus]BAO54036.1 hypothetical protein NMS_0027 [Nonlabens marinus S1-08]
MKKKNTHKDLGFEIPDGYFDTAMDRMFDTMNGKAANQELPFTVPKDYFENLESRILAATVEEKLKQSDSEITSPFDIPQGYFEQLEQRVLEVTADKPVVQMNRETPSWVVPLLAVAAIFIAMVTINGLFDGNVLTMQDIESDELAMYIADTDFTADQDAIDILYTDTDVLDDTAFNSSIDNEVLLNYLADEVDMNQMLEE